MAKQIYIDENGNPIEVSGTINTAELLPISANDPTDTKTYIATGLSGKQDKETHATESPFEFYKIGHIVVCHIDTGNINFKSDNKTIDATIPSAYRPSAISYYITKVYNGSYVECSVRFNTNGTVLITDTGNSAIPNIQANYLQQQYFTYFTA